MTAEQIVSPKKIEPELMRIWDSLQGTNKMRACLFNLIIYSKKDKRAEYLYEVAQMLISKFPSRIIFITGEEDAKEKYLKTSVSVISAQEGESTIVCDFINIAYGGDDKVRVPFVILPHILPDLPIYLLWGADPSKENSLLSQLNHLATRTIFDSETADHLPSFAQALLKREEFSEIADLNWARIEGWKELLTATFHSKEKLEDLHDAEEIDIQYNSKETQFFCHTKIQAIFLQSWLAIRLGWKLKKLSIENPMLCLTYDKGNGKEVSIHLIPQIFENLRPGRIISIEIKTSEKETYIFRRNSKYPQQIQVEFSTVDYCSLPSYYIMEKDESGQSLVKEICHKGISTHFLDLLEFLSKIEGEKLC